MGRAWALQPDLGGMWSTSATYEPCDLGKSFNLSRLMSTSESGCQGQKS